MIEHGKKPSINPEAYIVDGNGVLVPRHLIETELHIPAAKLYDRDSPQAPDDIYKRLYGTSSEAQRQIEQISAQEQIHISRELHIQEKQKKYVWNSFSTDIWKNISEDCAPTDTMNTAIFWLRRRERAISFYVAANTAERKSDIYPLERQYEQLTDEERIAFVHAVRSYISSLDTVENEWGRTVKGQTTILDVLFSENLKSIDPQTQPLKVLFNFNETVSIISYESPPLSIQDLESVLYKILPLCRERFPLRSMDSWNIVLDKLCDLSRIYNLQHETLHMDPSLTAFVIDQLAAHDDIRHQFGKSPESTWPTWDFLFSLTDGQDISVGMTETILSFMEYHTDLDHPLALKLFSQLPEDHVIRETQRKRVSEFLEQCQNYEEYVLDHRKLPSELFDLQKGIITLYPDGKENTTLGIEIETWPEVFGIPLPENFSLGVDGSDKTPEIRRLKKSIDFNIQWVREWTEFERWFDVAGGNKISLHLHTNETVNHLKDQQLLFMKYIGGIDGNDVRFNPQGTIEWRLPLEDYPYKKGMSFVANSRIIDFFIAAATEGYIQFDPNIELQDNTFSLTELVYRLTSDLQTRAAALLLQSSHGREHKGEHPVAVINKINLETIIDLPMWNTDFLFDHALKAFPEDQRFDLVKRKFETIMPVEDKKTGEMKWYQKRMVFFRLLPLLPDADRKKLLALFSREELESIHGQETQISYINYFPENQSKNYLERVLRTFKNEVNYNNLYNDVIQKTGMLYSKGEFLSLSEVYEFLLKNYKEEDGKHIENDFFFWRSFLSQASEFIPTAISRSELTNSADFYITFLSISTASGEKLRALTESFHSLSRQYIFSKKDVTRIVNATIINPASSKSGDVVGNLVDLLPQGSRVTNSKIIKYALQSFQLHPFEMQYLHYSIFRNIEYIPLEILESSSKEDFIIAFLEIGRNTNKYHPGKYLSKQVETAIEWMDRFIPMTTENIGRYIQKLLLHSDLSQEFTNAITSQLATCWFWYLNKHPKFYDFSPEKFKFLLDDLTRAGIHVYDDKTKAYSFVLGHYTKPYWHLRNGSPVVEKNAYH